MYPTIASNAGLLLRLRGATAVSAADLAKKGQIAKTAKDFEAQFMSAMLKPLFDTLPTDGPFGGGEAEGIWRSFLTDAIGSQIAKSGGIGIADSVQREMLKLQGLSSEGNAHGA